MFVLTCYTCRFIFHAIKNVSLEIGCYIISIFFKLKPFVFLSFRYYKYLDIIKVRACVA